MGLCLERIVTARGPVRWRFGKTGRCGGFAELGTRVEPVGRWRSSGRTRFRGRVVWMRLGAGRVQAPRRSVSSSGTATGIGNGYGLGWNRPRSTGSQRPLRDGHVRQRVAGRRRLRPPSKSGILDSSCLSNHFFFSTFSRNSTCKKWVTTKQRINKQWLQQHKVNSFHNRRTFD